MPAFLVYAVAAAAEIFGCFAFWMHFRLERGALWLLPGTLSLWLFAWALTRSPPDEAGRAYAVYGGVYIAGSLLWLWAVEGQRPDRWDLAGGLICLAGAGVILWGPRGG